MLRQARSPTCRTNDLGQVKLTSITTLFGFEQCLTGRLYPPRELQHIETSREALRPWEPPLTTKGDDPDDLTLIVNGEQGRFGPRENEPDFVVDVLVFLRQRAAPRQRIERLDRIPCEL